MAFRFGIMGAGHIAVKFCEAVKLLSDEGKEDCEVCAVASKSADRAVGFAKKNCVRRWYDNYEEMLVREEPDCVYIATTPDSHYELSMLCMKYHVPVLCEKAMFLNSKQAREVFAAAKENHVFAMEALWSRFLPAVKQAALWIEEGRIGKLTFAEFQIGFLAPRDGRYFSKKLGGGAYSDLTVYAYELADFLIHKEIRDMQVAAVWGPEQVDVTDQITIQYDDMAAALTGSLEAGLTEKAVIYGTRGSITIPHPHYGYDAYLSESEGRTEQFADTDTKNGFVYEISEVIHCVREGKIESEIVPHELTIRCSELFDRILATRPL